jgi:hypothetical protein
MIAAVLAVGLCLIGVVFANVSMTHSSAYSGNDIIAASLCMASVLLVTFRWKAWNRLRILGALVTLVALTQSVMLLIQWVHSLCR